MTDPLQLARRASREQTAMIGLFALLLAGVSAIPQYERSLIPGGQGAALVAGGGAPLGAVAGLSPLGAVRVVLPSAREAFRTASPTIGLTPPSPMPGAAVPAALVLPGSTDPVSGLAAEPARPRFALVGTATPGGATDFGSPSPSRALPGGGGLTGGGSGAIGGGGDGGGATPAPSPTPAPTATPTPAPIASPSPTPTASPSPTPTATPTPIASGTPAPTPSPTSAPSPSPDPLPIGEPPAMLPPVSGVPEPETWLLFVTGVGIAGAAMRRLRRPRAA